MKLVSLFIILFVCPSLFSQVVLPDKQYTTHDGLPQIQVMDMLQDSRGYIWVATKKGVARFNGESFSKVEIPILKSQHINHLYEDAKGRLYFFSQQKEGIVIQYDGLNFRSLTINQNFLGRTYFNKIKNNKLYVTNDSKEVLLYDLDSLKQEASIFLPDTINMISKLETNSLVGFRRGTNKLYDIESQKIVFQAEEGSSFNIKMNHRNCEKILIKKFIQDDKAFQILNSRLSDTEIKYQRKAPNFSTIHDLDLNNNSSISFINSDSEVVMISGKKVINKYKVSNTTRVICMHDIDDNLWISHENGIEFFSKNQLSKVPLDLVSDAWAFLPYNKGFIYSSYGDGIHQVDLNKNIRKPVFLNLQDNLNYGASKDKEGNMYFPGNLFLHKYDGQRIIKNYPLGPTNYSLVSYYDSIHNRVVVGGNKSVGLLDSDKEKIEYTIDNSNTIITRYVVSIQTKDEDNYWVGTYRDLASFNHKEKTYTSYNHIFPADSSGAVSLAVDKKNNNLWIGNAKGLWCLDETNNKLYEIGKEAFQNEYVTALLALPNQILAIGTSNGFSILNLREYNDNNNVVIKTFNHRNGFMGEEVAQSGLILEDDILYIPSSTYLSFVDISKLTFEEDFAGLMITEINDHALEWNRSEVAKIARGENSVSISFEGLGFNKPHETRYSYILEGVDKNWSPWVTNDQVNYNNLNSGDYIFKVKSQTNNFNYKNNPPEAEVQFELDLPFYKEATFYMYAAFSLLGLTLLSFYLFWRYRRTKEVTIAQDQQIKYLEVQALQSQMNPHFIFNVISTIQALILNKKTEEANKSLVSFSKLIRRFLDASVSSNIDRNNLNKDNSIPLSNEIELIRLYVDFELLQYKDKFDFELIVKEEVDIYNIHLPPMIIQPFVENAIKHGLLKKESRGKLLLEFYKNEVGLVCVIDDNGIGRKNAKQLQDQTMSLYISRGTELVFKRVNILNSLNQDITINTLDKSEPESGTRVEITFSKKSIS